MLIPKSSGARSAISAALVLAVEDNFQITLNTSQGSAPKYPSHLTKTSHNFFGNIGRSGKECWLVR